MGGTSKKRKTHGKPHASFLEHAIAWGGIALFMTALAAIVLLYEPSARKNQPEDTQRFYQELPGVNLVGLDAGQQRAVFEEVNRTICTCGCKMTLARCRNLHSACQISLKLCRELVEEFREPGESLEP